MLAGRPPPRREPPGAAMEFLPFRRSKRNALPTPSNAGSMALDIVVLLAAAGIAVASALFL